MNSEELAQKSKISELELFATAENRINLIKKYFVNKTDRMAIGHSSFKGALSVKPNDVDALIRTHLLGLRAPAASMLVISKSNLAGFERSGHYRAGAYAPGSDGLTKWLCIDYDGCGHANPLADAEAAALETMKEFLNSGITAYLEKSGGGHGWHLWVFFFEPIHCGLARSLGLKFAPKTAALLETGKYAIPEKNIGIEVFPKQSEHTAGSTNNQVWIPWWSEATNGANQFHRLGQNGELEQFDPESFETNDKKTIQELVGPELKSSSNSFKRESPQSAFLVNQDAILSGCSFLRYCRDNQQAVSEPQWYAAAGILAHMPDGQEQFHQMSKGHADYDYAEAEKKFDQASSSSGPRTCADTSTRWNGCQACPHNGKVKTPVQIGVLEKANELGDALLQHFASAVPDVGKPFEPENMAALRVLKNREPATFMRIREKLKAAKVSMKLLDDTLNRANRDSSTASDNGRYLVNEGKMAHRVQTKSGEFIEDLGNFSASIIREETADDGLERKTSFVIQGNLSDGRLLPDANVTAEEFAGMNWITKCWGALA
jgi:hypothetical protein